MKSNSMLTENRKRHLSRDVQEQLSPQAKRSGGLLSEPGRDVWDSESSSSDSSGISSPEWLAGAGSTNASCPEIRGNHVSRSPSSPRSSTRLAEELPGSSSQNGGESYHLINRILRDAHFSSLETRGLPRPT